VAIRDKDSIRQRIKISRTQGALENPEHWRKESLQTTEKQFAGGPKRNGLKVNPPMNHSGWDTLNNLYWINVSPGSLELCNVRQGRSIQYAS